MKKLALDQRNYLRMIRFYPLYLAQEGVDSPLFKKVGNLFRAGPDSPANAKSLGELILVVINILLLVAASIAVIFLIVGGYQYVIARGNEEAMEAAKKTMTSSIWGLVIIILSFVIINLIVRILLEGQRGLGF